ncbi:MAG: ABC transporter permease subunit [Vicinamibacterales bacterium]
MRAASPFRALRLCAIQELTLAFRSRWTQTFAVAFAVLALVVAVSGYVLSGGSGVQDFSRTAASLVQLVVLLVPLTALLLGVLALSSDRGNAELLFSQPVSRSVILMGRVAGLYQALVSAQAVGFGAAGLVIYSQAGEDGVFGFLVVVAAAFVLTGVSLGLAALIAAGNIGRRRSRGLAIALVVWLVLVVVADLAALGAASLLRSGAASRLLITAAIINPVGAVRTGSLLLIEGTAAFGSASLALLRISGGPVWASLWISASLALWLGVPFWVAARRLSRADI